MKKTIVIICTVLIICASCEKNSNTNSKIIKPPACEPETICNLDCEKPDNQTTKKILQLSTQNPSNGAYIINQFLEQCHIESNLTKTQQMELFIEPGYAKNNLETNKAYPFLDTLLSLSTVVHELSHALEASVSDESADCCETETMLKLFINETTTTNIEYTDVVNAKEMETIVPTYFQENGYYGLYVGTGNHAAAVLGIYALMSEFHAYYQDTYFSFGNINTLMELYNTSNNNIYLKALTYGVESTYLAYFDFKYYQLAYMDYCRQYVPDVYNAIKQNNAYWNAFNLIDEAFNQIINDYIAFLSNNQDINAFSSHNENTEYINRISAEIEKTETALSL